VIFDMDGLLVDSEPLHLAASNEILGKFGHRLDEESNRRFIGIGEERFWSILKEEMGISASIEELMAERSRTVSRLLEEVGIRTMPGVRERVREISERGYPLALASSTVRSQIDEVLAAAGLAPFFPIRVSGEDPEVKNGKPAPDIFLRAALLLRLDPSACLVFEDSQAGAQAARAAGMRCIAVPNSDTRHLDLSAADLLVESLEDVEVPSQVEG
jgi:HAD superfamily hydrolase (TIGR01509 family)